MTAKLSLFLSLINNLSVFIVLIAGYGFLTGQLKKYTFNQQRIILGLFFGLAAIASMHAKIPVADDLWSVRANPGYLQDAILNIAINARDAIAEWWASGYKNL